MPATFSAIVLISSTVNKLYSTFSSTLYGAAIPIVAQCTSYTQCLALRSSNTHSSTMYQLHSVLRSTEQQYTLQHNMHQLHSVLRCGAATLSAAVKISNSQWCTMYTVPVSFRDVLLTSTECHTREIHQSVPKCQESIISDTV